MLRRGAERNHFCLPKYYPRLVFFSRGPRAPQAPAWPPAPLVLIMQKTGLLGFCKNVKALIIPDSYD